MLQTKKSLSFLIFLLLSIALAVGTPAGEEITNQATAKYIDSAGDQQTANSNQVITVVKQVFGVSIVADGTTGAPGQSQNVTPGSTVYYPYTLTNTGNGIDDFDLTTDINTDDTSGVTTPVYFLDADGDGVVDSGESTAITRITDLPADQSVKIIMAYQIPTGAAEDDEIIASPIGTSVNDTATTKASDANNYHETTVIQDATIVVSKAVNVSEADPGDTLVYTITATNTGSKNATTVTITDAAPTGTTIVSASVATIPAGNAASTSIPTAIFATVIPGQTVRMSFSVTIDSSTLPSDLKNVASVAFTNSASEVTTVTTNEVVTEVLPSYGTAVGPKDDPLDGSTGDSATIVTYTTSEGYDVTSTADDSDTQTVDEVDAGDSASFINSVLNTGTDTDTFNITFTATNLPTASGYSVVLTRLDGTPLSDTDGDGNPDSGPLARNAEFDFIVKVLTPANANDIDDDTTIHSVVITSTSSEDASKTDTTTNVIEDILGPGVAFGNNTDVDVDAIETGADIGVDSIAVVNQTDDPGESVVFPMDVVNTGSNTDSYDLTGTVDFTDVDGSTITVAVDYYPASADTNGDGTLSDAEIAASTPISNTGNINPDTDAEITVFAVVDIPEGATPQVATVSQTVTSPLSGSTASFNTDTVTVNAIKDFSFSPDRNGTVPSPGTVIYQHSLTNNGNQNITDIDLSEAASGNTAGWTYVYSYDGTTYFPAASLPTTTITPGSNQTLFVKVNAPAGVPQNATNIVTITAEPTFGSDGAPTGSDSVTDTTTVISGELNVVKEWSADGGTTWFKGDGTDATTPPEVAPGEDILYRMTVINIGTGNVTDTQVLDSVPTFTDFVVASAVFQTTQGSSDTVTCSTDGGATFPSACPTTPAGINSSINAIQFFIDVLVPGASVEVRFAVRVQ